MRHDTSGVGVLEEATAGESERRSPVATTAPFRGDAYGYRPAIVVAHVETDEADRIVGLIHDDVHPAVPVGELPPKPRDM